MEGNGGVEVREKEKIGPLGEEKVEGWKKSGKYEEKKIGLRIYEGREKRGMAN